MKTLVLLALCCAAAVALPSLKSGIADPCTDDICTLAQGCRCASSASPLADDQIVPQFVSLTFDEAVTDELYQDVWVPLLYDRVNPDGQRIGATFFVPHEYTNYQRVNDLYNHGYEIAVHSITNNPLQSYWRGASEELLEEEFGGQKHITAKFANIPSEDIIGVRTPQLQLAGNLSIEAYIQSGLMYDSSWPTLNSKPLFPYTLDYLSTQQCTLGSTCPNGAFKGFWVLPIIDINGENTECNNLASCRVSGTADEISDWLLGEIEKVRTSTRAPLTLLVASTWFTNTENSWDGMIKALDTLATYDDVFLVSQREVLDWAKNPVNVSDFRTESYDRNAACTPIRCQLKLQNETTDRYMNSCVSCPETFPWLGNPDGKA